MFIYYNLEYGNKGILNGKVVVVSNAKEQYS